MKISFGYVIEKNPYLYKLFYINKIVIKRIRIKLIKILNLKNYSK
jgi:hypothetical protein